MLPTLDTWDVLHGVDAKVAWHLYLMAQPKDLPERMIEATRNTLSTSDTAKPARAKIDTPSSCCLASRLVCVKPGSRRGRSI